MALTRPREIALLALASLAISACSDATTLQFEHCESAHFRYSSHGGQASCSAELTRLEAHRAHFSAEVGIEPPFIDYFKYRDEAELRGANVCPERAQACAPEASVHTLKAFDEHELVHAFMPGRARPKLWVEGLAEALSCRTEPRSCTGDWRAVEATGDSTDQIALYACGSQLAYRLMAHLGLAAVAPLNETLAVREPALELDRGLAEHGLELEQVWNSEVLSGSGFCVPFSACAGAELAIGSDQLLPYTAGDPTRRLPTTPGKLVRLRARGERLSFALASCEATLEPGRDDGFATYEPTPAEAWLETDGGNYAITKLSALLDVDIFDHGFPTSCETDVTEPYAAALGQPLTLRLPLDGRIYTLPLQIDGGSHVDLELDQPTAFASALFCDDCASAHETCRTLSWSEQGIASLEVATGVLVLSTNPTLPPAAATLTARVRR